MTAQCPHIFKKSFGLKFRIKTFGFALYRVIRGDTNNGRLVFDDYVHKINPEYKPEVDSSGRISRCSANWSGFTSKYHLNRNGELLLVNYGSATPKVYKQSGINEVLEGNFWIDIRKDFYAAQLMIPFIEGSIVEDTTQWVQSLGLRTKTKHVEYDNYRVIDTERAIKNK